MSMTSLGKLQRLIIGHDGVGHGAGWYLEKVTVREQHGDESEGRKELVFPCNRWLDDHEDDGRTERELLAAGKLTSVTFAVVIYRVAQKKPHTILLSISLLNIDRFS